MIRSLPEPMRVSDWLVERCRREVESESKRRARAILLPLMRWRYGLDEVGEGFQWGLPLGLPSRKVRLGRYVYIGAYGSCAGPLVVGDLTMISSHVKIFGDDHQIAISGEPARLAFASEHKLTVIEADCWVGQGAMLREGIRIGRGTVVAAGAIVTRSVPPYEIVGGTPARLIRRRFTAEEAVRHDEALYGIAPSSDPVSLLGGAQDE